MCRAWAEIKPSEVGLLWTHVACSQFSGKVCLAVLLTHEGFASVIESEARI